MDFRAVLLFIKCSRGCLSQAQHYFTPRSPLPPTLAGSEEGRQEGLHRSQPCSRQGQRRRPVGRNELQENGRWPGVPRCLEVVSDFCSRLCLGVSWGCAFDSRGTTEAACLTSGHCLRQRAQGPREQWTVPEHLLLLPITHKCLLVPLDPCAFLTMKVELLNDYYSHFKDEVTITQRI